MANFNIIDGEDINYVEIELNNESIRAESGALHYMQGDISMESSLPSVGGFIKAKFSGESVFKPRYTGTGKVVLEPSFNEFYEITLEDESYVLDKGAYWASDDSVEISATINSAISGLFSGEGFVQTLVKGKGTVIVSTPGPLQQVKLDNDKLVVDGSFAVARSANLKFSVQKSSKSIIGSVTSGEGLVNVFEGTGEVYIAPVPNKNILLMDILRSAMTGMEKK